MTDVEAALSVGIVIEAGGRWSEEPCGATLGDEDEDVFLQLPVASKAYVNAKKAFLEKQAVGSSGG